MPSQDLTISLHFNESPDKVYAAINDVKSWWLGEITGRAAHVGDQFEYRYKEFHTSKQTVSELKPEKRVVWSVGNSALTFLKHNESEWDGTEVIFELKPSGQGTDLHFTHKSLRRDCECFEACLKGWTHHLTKNLSFLVENSTARPIES